MNVSLIAERYARALFGLASEKGVLDNVYRDVVELDQAVRENRFLRLFFRAPVISPGKKKATMKAIFGSHFDPLTMKYIDFLTGKRRDAIIPEIALQFIQEYKNFKGILTVKLKTAVSVDDTIRKRVAEIMRRYSAAPNIEFVEEVDPEVIGGFVLSWNDYQYDATVSRQLERLRRGVARVNLYVKGF